MARLPNPGQDAGQWGTPLNEYLSESHETDGSLKPIPQSKVTNLITTLATKANTSAIPTTPSQVGAEPEGLSNTTLAAINANLDTQLAQLETSAPTIGIGDFVARLDMRADSIITAAICGDSTSDSKASSTDSRRDRGYALMLRQACAALWPERKVDYYERWAGGSATDGRSDPPVTWQAGYIPPTGTKVDVFRDSFTRTGNLSGSTPDVGGIWAGGSGMTTDGSVARLTGAAYVNQPTTLAHTGIDLDFSVAAKLTTVTSITRVTTFYAAYVDNNSYIRVTIDCRANAVYSMFLGIKASGTERTVLFPVGTIPNNVALNDVAITIHITGTALSATVNANTVNATLTSSEQTALTGWTKVGLYADDTNFQMNNLVLQAYPVVTGNAVILPEIRVYNQSVPGTRADHFVNNGNMAIAYPVRPDVLFINHGHNYLLSDGVQGFLDGIDAFYTAFSAIWPNVPVVVLSQNPEFATQPSANIKMHLNRMVALKAHAAFRGWEYIATYEEMTKPSDGGASLVIYSGSDQGLHPNTAGSQVQADVGVRFIKAHSARTPV